MATNEVVKPLPSDGKSAGPNPYDYLVDNDNNKNIAAGTPSSNSRLLACLRCQQRKVKCDRSQPCSSCTKARVECTPVPVLTPRRRKRRFPEAELLARLRRYEVLLKSYGADLDAINGESGGKPPKTRTEISTGVEGHGWINKKEGIIPVENNVWPNVKNEFRDTEEVLAGSSDDEFVPAPITTTWETMHTNNTALLLFGSQHTHTNLTTFHPQPMDAMRLWQMFLDNVNPLTKVIHAPTTQQQILENSMNLGNVSRDMEALLFSIYLLAILSMDDSRCKESFGMGQSELVAKYQFGAQQSLLNAEFLRPSSLVILQALVLYLLSLRYGVDPRSVSCLGVVTLRLAQQMGLHRDGRGQGLTPFEVEMRRRVWWSIVVFNSRISEFSGVGTAVLTHQWTTRLPSNVNDSDLYPNMREPPVDHKGPTEMIFAMTKYEVAEFLRCVRSTTAFDGCWHELSSSQISLSAKDKAIDELETAVERKYLRHCDASIPLHFITVTMTKSAICKLRHIAHHPRLLPDRGASLPQVEKDLFFGLGLKMLEYSSLLHSNEGTRKFMWHIIVNRPMDGYIHVLNELRHRTTGEMADRAWQQILECLTHFVYSKKWDKGERESAIFIALSNMATKAWEARANALRQTQSFVACPETISQMQAYLDMWRANKLQLATNDLSLTAPTSGDPGYSEGRFMDAIESHNYSISSGAMGALPMEDSFDWMYWNGLTQEYPLTGVEFDGANSFSIN